MTESETSKSEDVSKLKLLLVEDNEVDAFLTYSILLEEPSFGIVQSENLNDALHNLQNNQFDIVILDLNLSDSQGFNTFARIKSLTNVPVVVLTGIGDEKGAISFIQNGAQDYIIKGKYTREVLNKSILFAVERAKLLEKINSLSMTDELTDVLNRRAFFIETNKYIELAKRRKYSLYLIFVDIDSLKKINDFYGHEYGDDAIKQTAEILKNTFRKSDIIARIGGDEFVVCTTVDNDFDSIDLIKKRLLRNLDTFNENNIFFKLSFSVGISHLKSDEEKKLDVLLQEADIDMYRDKESKK